ncbi:alpha/beta fold hydrolase [Actinomyces respiraculi]|uniref:alpha/beta fold hydrolase n=1 Tax=Actinomyces respiraculi TaxID=2744574 RepID=UPI0039A6879F
MFGLPQWCNARGVDWVGVNYRGSLMPDPRDTRSAWRGWRATLQEDLEGALARARGPVILAGWSFGAAIALALGGVSGRVRGLLLGGVPGGLRRHVERAVALDQGHRLVLRTVRPGRRRRRARRRRERFRRQAEGTRGSWRRGWDLPCVPGG